MVTHRACKRAGRPLKGRALLAGLVSIWAVLGLTARDPLASQGGIPPYSDLKARIDSAYESRLALLRYSTGRARLSMDQTKVFLEGAGRIAGGLMADLGVDPASLRPLSVVGQWDVAWYRDGQKYRYDVSVGPGAQSGGDGLPLFLPTHMRAASNPDERPYTIYYDVLTDRAYIRPGSLPLHRSFGLFRCFDVAALYELDDRPVPEMLARFEAAHVVPELSEDRIEGIRCIKVEFDSPTAPGAAAGRKKRAQLWLAPEMSVSLVRARLWDNGPTAYKEFALIESYDASYEESQSFRGTWLLKHIRTAEHQYSTPGGVHNADHHTETRLEVTIADTQLKAAIPPETFTPEGLGLSSQTKIHDASLAGHPLTYYRRFLW